MDGASAAFKRSEQTAASSSSSSFSGIPSWNNEKADSKNPQRHEERDRDSKKRSRPKTHMNQFAATDPNRNIVASAREEKRDSSRIRKKKRKKVLELQERIIAFATDAQYTGSVAFDLSNSALQATNVPSRTLRLVTSSQIPSWEQRKQVGLSQFNSKCSNIYVQPLLVLDLNGILCHRIRSHKEPPQGAVSYRPATHHVAGTPVIPRPFLAEFLTFLDQNFCLAVWTSAKPKTAKSLVTALFPQHVAQNLLFLWGQNRCNTMQGQGADGEVVFQKDLRKVWQEFPLWDQFNTLLLDDTPDKCSSFQLNGLHPAPLNGVSYQDAKNHDWLSDEQNHRLQMDFFAKLASYWKNEHRLEAFWDEAGNFQFNQAPEKVWDFLQQHGRCHMGWNI
jgi:hypothetical protein